MEYYSAIKKEWNFAIYNNIAGPGEYYPKLNKSDRERQTLYDIPYGESKKTKQMNKHKTETEL